MSDHFPGSIEIGGELPRAKLEEFIAALTNDGPGLGAVYEEGGATEEEYRRFIENDESRTGSITFSDPEARYGMFDNIEPFCAANDLVFVRRSSSHHEFDAELVWSTPNLDNHVTVWANGDGEVLIKLEKLVGLLEFTYPTRMLKRLIAENTPPTVPPFVVK